MNLEYTKESLKSTNIWLTHLRMDVIITKHAKIFCFCWKKVLTISLCAVIIFMLKQKLLASHLDVEYTRVIGFLDLIIDHCILICGQISVRNFFVLCTSYLIWEVLPIATDVMINEEIRDPQVRVIANDGSQLGIMSSEQALQLAEEQQLDLVKIAPTANPPVCKIMDYGKYRFEQDKRERDARKNQKVISVKELRLSPVIEDHDVGVRVKNCVKFLKDGNKVKVTIRFRGRMLSHSELGYDVMNDFYERVKDVANMDKRPAVEGRTMTMILSPKSDK